MSLVPMLYSDWWEDLDRPHSILDQHFGTPLDSDEILHRSSGGITNRHIDNLGYPFFRRMRRRYHPFHHALSYKHAGKQQNKVAPSTAATAICNTDRDKFVISLDVKQFTLDEIIVKTIEKNVILIDARHEEREDEHGWISRRFTRKYNLPLNYDIEQIESSLSSDGVLTVAAPKKIMAGDKSEKIIKIQYTGEPAILEQQQQQSPRSLQPRTDESYHKDHSLQQQQQRAGPMMSQQRGKKITVKGI